MASTRSSALPAEYSASCIDTVSDATVVGVRVGVSEGMAVGGTDVAVRVAVGLAGTDVAVAGAEVGGATVGVKDGPVAVGVRAAPVVAAARFRHSPTGLSAE